MTTITLKLENLSCGHCVNHTKKALEAVSGVESAEVSLTKAVVNGSASAESLIQAVIDAGYNASLK